MSPLWGFDPNLSLFSINIKLLWSFSKYTMERFSALEERNVYRKELTNLLKLRRSEMLTLKYKIKKLH